MKVPADNVFEGRVRFYHQRLVSRHVTGDATELVTGILSVTRAAGRSDLRNANRHMLGFQACVRNNHYASDVNPELTERRIRDLLSPSMWQIENLHGRTWSDTVPYLSRRNITERNRHRHLCIRRWTGVSSALARLLLAMSQPVLMSPFGVYWGHDSGRLSDPEGPLHDIARYQAVVSSIPPGNHHATVSSIAEARSHFRDAEMTLSDVLGMILGKQDLEPFRDACFDLGPNDSRRLQPDRLHFLCERGKYRLWLHHTRSNPWRTRPLLVEVLHGPSGRFFPLDWVAPPAGPPFCPELR